MPENEKIGRNVKGALGVDETLVLEKRYWRYYDWLAEQGEDMSLWTQEADICRLGNECFATWERAVSHLLITDERKRFHLELDCPLLISPGGYNVPDNLSISEIRIIERLPNDNELVERKYQNALGVDVSIQIPGKYWRHLDWICEQAGEHLAQEWVTHAEFDRSDPNVTLAEKLKFHLAQHEENIYLDYMGNIDLELPMYISPIGYWERYGQSVIERTYLDSNDNEISIRLYRKFWWHLDRLDSFGEDSRQFVKNIHRVSQMKGEPENFDAALCQALLRDFKSRIAKKYHS